MIASLPYGPPVNADIDYYRTFFRLLLFCECCIVTCSCVIFVRRREASACLIILSAKQGSHWYHFNAVGMARPGFEPTTSRSRSGCSTTGLLQDSGTLTILYTTWRYSYLKVVLYVESTLDYSPLLNNKSGICFFS